MEVTNNVMMLRQIVSVDKANNGVNRANIYQQTKKNHDLWWFDSIYINVVHSQHYSFRLNDNFIRAIRTEALTN
jgi:hypothetical protein